MPDGNAWVDPRTDPAPPAGPRQLARDPAEITDLLDLCHSGRIYDVERWIAAGRPIQGPREPMWQSWSSASAVTIAIETRQRDLLRLLLCNGYQLNLDQRPALDLALRERRWDTVDLLLEWGAEAARADPDIVLDTYSAELFERFWQAGNDFTREDCLAHYLARTSSNRPLYGWVRRHQDDPRIQRALARALVQAIWGRRGRAVHLIRWAGADPHLKVPLLEWHRPETPDEEEDLFSGVQMAVEHGQGKLLRFFKPDPGRDDMEALWGQVEDPDAVDFLFAVKPPNDWSPAILHNLHRIANRWFGDDADRHRRCLQRIAALGGRLTSADADGFAYLRQQIGRMTQTDVRRWMLWWVSEPTHCAPGLYVELTRTPKMRSILSESGLLPKGQQVRKGR